MAILIDPPVWPAHGTTFSHLVSDTSLEELHTFARARGVHPRAFDLDHYDVPAESYDALVAAGAHPVRPGAGATTHRLGAARPEASSPSMILG